MVDRAGVHYTLTDASSEDTPWLETLRRNVYQELFLLTWGGWDEARHQRHFAASLERHCISILSIDDTAVGMLQLFENDDGLEIGEIQIMPTRQNLGIGTQVLKDIILLGTQSRKDVRLRVGLQNGKARRLYERLGFVVEMVSQTHYHMVRFPVLQPSEL
jgi:ribosomal protein S18 acetylase RimI-like enzyme